MPHFAHLRLAAVVAALGTFLSGCGGSTNFNQIWGGDDEAGDSLYLEAQAAYDSGEFDKAEELVNRLLERNSRNEAAAVLSGYISLSKGGIDPFRLARELIAISEEDAAKKKAETQLQDSGSSSSNSTSSLRELAARLINLSKADFETLTGEEFATGLFKEAPIYVPENITDDVRNSVFVLNQMNKSIKAVCRFVHEDVKKIEGQDRYSGEDCEPYPEASTRNRAKAHFLWAFSHLTESLVYQLVLLYSSGSSGTSNFETVAATLDKGVYQGEDGVRTFLTDVTTMKTAVEKVFGNTDDGSMLVETLSDLEAVNLAFTQLAGLPSGVTERITKSLETIKKLGSTLGNGTAGNAKALKGQMIEKMSKTVGGKVDKVIEQRTGTKELTPEAIEALPYSDAQKEKLSSDVQAICQSYDGLAEGLTDEAKAKNEPAACKSF